MNRSRKNPSFVLSWLLIFVTLAAGPLGCASWKKQAATPEALLARNDPPPRMRLVLLDGSRIDIKKPAVRGDSLFGILKRTIVYDDRWDETRTSEGGVSLADIRSVEIRKADTGKTLLLVAAGIGATVLVVAATTDKEQPQPLPRPSSSGGSGGSGDGCLFCSCPLVYSSDGRDWALCG